MAHLHEQASHSVYFSFFLFLQSYYTYSQQLIVMEHGDEEYVNNKNLRQDRFDHEVVKKSLMLISTKQEISIAHKIKKVKNKVFSR